MAVKPWEPGVCQEDPPPTTHTHTHTHTHTTTMEEKNARQSYLSIPQPKLIVSGADQPQNHGVFIQDGSLESTQISDSQSVFSEALEFYRST